MGVPVRRSGERSRSRLTLQRQLVSSVLGCLLLVAAPFPASALSEIQNGQATPAPGAAEPAASEPVAPKPDGSGEETVPGDQARPEVEPEEPLAEIVYNLDRLPEPVRRMHDLILAAAKTGEIERIRPYIGTGEAQTQLSFGGVEGDPVAFLKGLSGDSEGQEILAILEEVLSAGFVHLDAGTPNELYVWPYFFAVPLDKLTPPQRVELFKLVTAGDYEDMKAFGSYIFYRVGIGPDGRWNFFVAGD